WASRIGLKGRKLNVHSKAVLRDGDVITAIGGTPIETLQAFGEKLAKSEGSVRIAFEDPEGNKRAGSFNLLDYKAPPPPPVLGSLVLLLVGVAVLLLWVAPFAGIITVIERKIGARMQSRVGPNRVGPQGFLQWLADGIKVMQKEDLIPDGADPIL